MSDRNTYWSTWEIKKLLPELVQGIEMYFKKLEQDSLLDLWVDCMECFYNYKTDGEHGRVIEFHRGIIDGSSTEQINVRGNLFRAFIVNILQSVTTNTPLWRPIATNNDYSTQAQVVAAKNLLDHNYREYNANKVFLRSAESANLTGTGYVIQYWDVIDKELRMYASNPLRVVTPLQANHKPQWYIVAERVCKWDIVEKYQVSKDNLSAISNENINRFNTNAGINNVFDLSMGEKEWKYNRDYMDIFHFFHDRTPAIKDGRYVIFSNDKHYFYDGGLPFDMPVHTLSPSGIMNSPYSYSPAFDLISYSKMHDAILSNIIDRLFKGRQWVSTQSDGSAKLEIDKANRIIKGAKAEAIDTTSLPEVLLKVHELNKREMQLVTARNSTVLGESDAKSGAHAALLYQVANQFTNAFNVDYTALVEAVGTAQLDLIKTYMEDPIKLRLSGEDNEPYMVEFKTDQIENIHSVAVKTVNPMLATPAGQLTVAQDILAKDQSPQAIKRYLRVLDGGDIDEFFEDDRDVELTITHEHEMLANYRNIGTQWIQAENGVPIPPRLVIPQVRALVSDPHNIHLQEHLKWRSSPRVRNNPILLQFLDKHIEDHFWQSQNGDIRYLTASGQQRMPNPEAAPPPLPAGVGGPPPVPNAGIPTNPVIPGRGVPQMESTQHPPPRALPNQPNMPKPPMQGSPAMVAGSDQTG